METISGIEKIPYLKIIKELSENRNVFKALLAPVGEELYLWKPNPQKWCLLEIVCHLYDIEREDFRLRTAHVLSSPTEPLPPIDPPGWVSSRAYIQQDYQDKLNDFLTERTQSVSWLQNLSNPAWENAYEHPKLGKITANMLLSNWLAHDYLHIRQITKLKYDYLRQLTHEDLGYAGNW
ncbi:DinB family protein [Olivibacter ginsenosidimutans]|uniref:DinB family protein n=2 Tax=Olivibacter ginsenosidimutans TaxID=1176537 RepID=A0ABP9B323_9SPHI